MAKRKSTKQSGVQLGIRVSDSEHTDFLRIANLEGFDTIQKWMISLAERRSRIVNDSIESGDFMEIDGKLIPFHDLPHNVEIKKKS